MGKSVVNPESARAIMGINFFGIEEATQHFGIKPTKAQLIMLAEIPFTEAVLQECRNTHILVAAFPLSILDIQKKVERKLFCSPGNVWCNTESFAKKKGKTRWYLILKGQATNSICRTWDEQQAFLGEDEYVPTVLEVVYAIIGHYLVTGKRLFENIYVRCADITSAGYRVYVGSFDRDGLYVNYWWGGNLDGHVAFASSHSPR